MARDDCYAICPHCGHKHGGCWEWVKDTPRDHRCDGCDQLFSVYAEYFVDYITSVKLVEPAEAGDMKPDAPRIAALGTDAGNVKPSSVSRECPLASGTKREGEGE